MAWSTVVATLRRFEIIDILVQPELNIIPDVPPPQYLAAYSKEATEFFRAQSCPPPSPPSARQLSPARSLGAAAANPVPGTVLAAAEDGIDVACGRGTLRILRLQLAGRRPLAAREFIQGRKLDGEQFVHA